MNPNRVLFSTLRGPIQGSRLCIWMHTHAHACAHTHTHTHQEQLQQHTTTTNCTFCIWAAIESFPWALWQKLCILITDSWQFVAIHTVISAAHYKVITNNDWWGKDIPRQSRTAQQFPCSTRQDIHCSLCGYTRYKLMASLHLDISTIPSAWWRDILCHQSWSFTTMTADMFHHCTGFSAACFALGAFQFQVALTLMAAIGLWNAFFRFFCNLWSLCAASHKVVPLSFLSFLVQVKTYSADISCMLVDGSAVEREDKGCCVHCGSGLPFPHQLPIVFDAIEVVVMASKQYLNLSGVCGLHNHWRWEDWCSCLVNPHLAEKGESKMYSKGHTDRWSEWLRMYPPDFAVGEENIIKTTHTH